VFALWLFRQPPRAVVLAQAGLFPERMRATTLRHPSDLRASHRGGPVDHLLAPLDALAGTTPGLVRDVTGQLQTAGEAIELASYSFLGPQAADDPIRVGVFAGIHGDEVAGPMAAVRLLQLLVREPELARGYELSCYPVCNPSGFEDGTRHSRRGHDLNREFWRESVEPEVVMLEEQLRKRSFHGIISLHSDDTSDGVYGFARGAMLTRHLVRPALESMAQVLPLNEAPVIDGFAARRGMIREVYEGILSAPADQRPKPFEVILETPHTAPVYLQAQALVLGVGTILREYRQFIAYALNL
jgi:hypothetical protein